jgi:hypothetical protein
VATYLPSENDPQYSVFEASYPKYRQSLEQRYPQVCRSCAPRVEKRIRDAGYAAKTDHLRRLMERSKAGGRLRGQRIIGWRDLIIASGGLAYWASIAGQVTWGIVAAAFDDANANAGTSMDNHSSTTLECIWDAVRLRPVCVSCLRSTLPYQELSLVLAACSLWWNNKLSEKLQSPGVRTTGWGDYFCLQVVLLAVKMSSWYFLQHPWTLGLSIQTFQAAHLFILILIIIVRFQSPRSLLMSTDEVLLERVCLEPDRSH